MVIYIIIVKLVSQIAKLVNLKIIALFVSNPMEEYTIFILIVLVMKK